MLFLRKALAVAISILFLSQDILYGASISAALSQPLAYKIPAGLGKIETYHRGTSDKTIIFVQDAHDSIQAQMNIARIIRQAVTRYGVKTVFEEGYEGPVPTDKVYKALKDPRIREAVSYYLLDHLRIGGAEYAHVNRFNAVIRHGSTPIMNKNFVVSRVARDKQSDFKLIGADSIKGHFENVRWFRRSVKEKAPALQDIDLFLSEFQRLADENFSKREKFYLKLKQSFDAGQIDLLHYLKRVRSLAPQSSSYHSIDLLLKADQVNRPAMREQIKNMTAQGLFAELQKMEDEIEKNIFEKKPSSLNPKIYSALKHLSRIKRLLDFKMTPAELMAVKQGMLTFDTQAMAQMLVQKTNRSAVFSKTWEASVLDAIRFYESALKRETAAETQLNHFFKQTHEKIAVLVYGGFHRQGIESLLSREGVSYYVVSPAIHAVDAQHHGLYQKLMEKGYDLNPAANKERTAPSVSLSTSTKTLPQAARLISELEMVRMGSPEAFAQLETFHRELSAAARAVLSQMKGRRDPPEYISALMNRRLKIKVMPEAQRSEVRQPQDESRFAGGESMSQPLKRNAVESVLPLAIPEPVKQTVLKNNPRLANTANWEEKLGAIRAALGVSDKEMLDFFRAYPFVVTYTPETLKRKWILLKALVSDAKKSERWEGLRGVIALNTEGLEMIFNEAQKQKRKIEDPRHLRRLYERLNSQTRRKYGVTVAGYIASEEHKRRGFVPADETRSTRELAKQPSALKPLVENLVKQIEKRSEVRSVPPVSQEDWKKTIEIGALFHPLIRKMLSEKHFSDSAVKARQARDLNTALQSILPPEPAGVTEQDQELLSRARVTLQQVREVVLSVYRVKIPEPDASIETFQKAAEKIQNSTVWKRYEKESTAKPDLTVTLENMVRRLMDIYYATGDTKLILLGNLVALGTAAIPGLREQIYKNADYPGHLFLHAQAIAAVAIAAIGGREAKELVTQLRSFKKHLETNRTEDADERLLAAFDWALDRLNAKNPPFLSLPVSLLRSEVRGDSTALKFESYKFGTLSVEKRREVIRAMTAINEASQGPLWGISSLLNQSIGMPSAFQNTQVYFAYNEHKKPVAYAWISPDMFGSTLTVNAIAVAGIQKKAYGTELAKIIFKEFSESPLQQQIYGDIRPDNERSAKFTARLLTQLDLTQYEMELSNGLQTLGPQKTEEVLRFFKRSWGKDNVRVTIRKRSEVRAPTTSETSTRKLMDMALRTLSENKKQRKDSAEIIGAINFLSELGVESVTDEIAGFVMDSNPHLSEEAVQALGRIGGAKAMNHLVGFIDQFIQRIHQKKKNLLWADDAERQSAETYFEQAAVMIKLMLRSLLRMDEFAGTHKILELYADWEMPRVLHEAIYASLEINSKNRAAIEEFLGQKKNRHNPYVYELYKDIAMQGSKDWIPWLLAQEKRVRGNEVEEEEDGLNPAALLVALALAGVGDPAARRDFKAQFAEDTSARLISFSFFGKVLTRIVREDASYRETIQGRLKKDFLTADEGASKTDLALALAALEDESVVVYLMDQWGRTRDDRFKAEIEHALLFSEHPATLPLWTAMYRDKTRPMMDQNLARAKLGRIDTPEAMKELTDMLSDKDPSNRQIAYSLLYEKQARLQKIPTRLRKNILTDIPGAVWVPAVIQSRDLKRNSEIAELVQQGVLLTREEGIRRMPFWKQEMRKWALPEQNIYFVPIRDPSKVVLDNQTRTADTSRRALIVPREGDSYVVKYSGAQYPHVLNGGLAVPFFYDANHWFYGGENPLDGTFFNREMTNSEAVQLALDEAFETDPVFQQARQKYGIDEKNFLKPMIRVEPLMIPMAILAEDRLTYLPTSQVLPMIGVPASEHQDFKIQFYIYKNPTGQDVRLGSIYDRPMSDDVWAPYLSAFGITQKPNKQFEFKEKEISETQVKELLLLNSFRRYALFLRLVHDHLKMSGSPEDESDIWTWQNLSPLMVFDYQNFSRENYSDANIRYDLLTALRLFEKIAEGWRISAQRTRQLRAVFRDILIESGAAARSEVRAEDASSKSMTTEEMNLFFDRVRAVLNILPQDFGYQNILGYEFVSMDKVIEHLGDPLDETNQAVAEIYRSRGWMMGSEGVDYEAKPRPIHSRVYWIDPHHPRFRFSGLLENIKRGIELMAGVYDQRDLEQAVALVAEQISGIPSKPKSKTAGLASFEAWRILAEDTLSLDHKFIHRSEVRVESADNEKNIRDLKRNLLEYMNAVDANHKNKKTNEIRGLVMKGSAKVRAEFKMLVSDLLSNERERSALRVLGSTLTETDAGQRARLRRLYEHFFNEKGRLRKEISVLSTNLTQPTAGAADTDDTWVVKMGQRVEKLILERVTSPLSGVDAAQLKKIFAPHNTLTVLEQMGMYHFPWNDYIFHVVRNKKNEIVAYAWAYLYQKDKVLGLGAVGVAEQYRKQGIAAWLRLKQMGVGLRQGLTRVKTHVAWDGRRNGWHWSLLKLGFDIMALRFLGMDSMFEGDANKALQAVMAGVGRRTAAKQKSAIEAVLKRFPEASIVMGMTLSHGALSRFAQVFEQTRIKRSEVRLGSENENPLNEKWLMRKIGETVLSDVPGQGLSVSIRGQYFDPEDPDLVLPAQEIARDIVRALRTDQYSFKWLQDLTESRFAEANRDFSESQPFYVFSRPVSLIIHEQIVRPFLQHEHYAQVLRRINSDKAPPDFQVDHDRWVKAVRYPELYDLISSLRPSRPEEALKVLILGPGRRRIANSGKARSHSPQMVEILTALAGQPAEYTVVDGDSAVLAAAANPEWYQITGAEFSQASTEFKAKLRKSLGGITEQKFLKRLRNKDNVFRVDRELLSKATIDTHWALFENLDYGENRLDAVIATMSLLYALASFETVDEGLDYLARLVRALKPGGKIFITKSTLYKGLTLRGNAAIGINALRRKTDLQAWKAQDASAAQALGLAHVTFDQRIAYELENRLGFRVQITGNNNIQVLTREAARSEVRSAEEDHAFEGIELKPVPLRPEPVVDAKFLKQKNALQEMAALGFHDVLLRELAKRIKANPDDPLIALTWKQMQAELPVRDWAYLEKLRTVSEELLSQKKYPQAVRVLEKLALLEAVYPLAAAHLDAENPAPVLVGLTAHHPRFGIQADRIAGIAGRALLLKIERVDRQPGTFKPQVLVSILEDGQVTLPRYAQVIQVRKGDRILLDDPEDIAKLRLILPPMSGAQRLEDVKAMLRDVSKAHDPVDLAPKDALARLRRQLASPEMDDPLTWNEWSSVVPVGASGKFTVRVTRAGITRDLTFNLLKKKAAGAFQARLSLIYDTELLYSLYVFDWTGEDQQTEHRVFRIERDDWSNPVFEHTNPVERIYDLEQARQERGMVKARALIRDHFLSDLRMNMPDFPGFEAKTIMGAEGRLLLPVRNPRSIYFGVPADKPAALTRMFRSDLAYQLYAAVPLLADGTVDWSAGQERLPKIIRVTTNKNHFNVQALTSLAAPERERLRNLILFHLRHAEKAPDKIKPFDGLRVKSDQQGKIRFVVKPGKGGSQRVTFYTGSANRIMMVTGRKDAKSGRYYYETFPAPGKSEVSAEDILAMKKAGPYRLHRLKTTEGGLLPVAGELLKTITPRSVVFRGWYGEGRQKLRDLLAFQLTQSDKGAPEPFEVLVPLDTNGRIEFRYERQGRRFEAAIATGKHERGRALLGLRYDEFGEPVFRTVRVDKDGKAELNSLKQPYVFYHRLHVSMDGEPLGTSFTQFDTVPEVWRDVPLPASPKPARSEVRMVSDYQIRETFGDVRVGPTLSGGRNEDFLYENGRKVAVHMPWGKFVFRALDADEREIPNRSYKITHYASDNEMLFEEARLLFKLSQQPAVSGVPRLVRIGMMDIKKSGGMWIEQEGLSDARSLDREVFGRLPRLFETLIKAGEIIKQVHARGIVHADLKPAQFLINNAQELQLIDFGNAREIGSAETRDNYTTGYVPIDQDGQPITSGLAEDTDVYSFVIMVAELIGHQMQSGSVKDGMEPLLRRMRDDYLRLVLKDWNFEYVQELWLPTSQKIEITTLPRKKWPISIDIVLDKLRGDLRDVQQFTSRSEMRSSQSGSAQQGQKQDVHSLTDFILETKWIGDRQMYSAVVVPNIAALQDYAQQHDIYFVRDVDLLHRHEIQALLWQSFEASHENAALEKKIRKIGIWRSGWGAIELNAEMLNQILKDDSESPVVVLTLPQEQRDSKRVEAEQQTKLTAVDPRYFESEEFAKELGTWTLPSGQTAGRTLELLRKNFKWSRMEHYRELLRLHGSEEAMYESMESLFSSRPRVKFFAVSYKGETAGRVVFDEESRTLIDAIIFERNRGNYVGDAVLHLLKQTYGPFNLVVPLNVPIHSYLLKRGARVNVSRHIGSLRLDMMRYGDLDQGITAEAQRLYSDIFSNYANAILDDFAASAPASENNHLYQYHPELYDLIYQRFAKRLGDFLALVKQNTPHGAAILDVAAGTGQVTVPLLQAGYHVQSTDVHAGMLEQLKQRARKQGVAAQTHVIDFLSMDKLTETFDAVTVRQAMNYLIGKDNLVKGLSAMRNRLKPGGKLIFNAPNYDPAHFTPPSRDPELIQDGKFKALVRERNTIQSHVLTHHQEALIWEEGQTPSFIHDVNKFEMYTKEQLEAALQEAGFDSMEFFSSGGKAYDAKDPVLYVVATARARSEVRAALETSQPLKIILVGGSFDRQGGAASSLITQIHAGLPQDAVLVNGGNFEDIPGLVTSLDRYDVILWFPNIPNEMEKYRNIKGRYPQKIVVTSKRNHRNQYSVLDVVRHALKLKSNLVVEFSDTLPYTMRLIDPLANIFEDTQSTAALTRALIQRLEIIARSARQSTQRGDSSVPIPAVPNDPGFFKFIQDQALAFHELMKSRTGGDESAECFRCERGFPSLRHGDTVFVSKREADAAEKYFTPESMVPVDMRHFLQTGEIRYWGKKKPAVDTPIQLRLYRQFPKIKYILHSHEYIEGAVFTDKVYGTEALEEFDQILKVVGEDSGLTYAVVNQKGHGSIVLASTMEELTRAHFVHRPSIHQKTEFSGVLVGGAFDHAGGKASPWVEGFHRTLPREVELYNGGSLEDLDQVLSALGRHEVIFWAVNTSETGRDFTAEIKNRYPFRTFVPIFENYDGRIPFQQLINRALLVRSNLFVELQGSSESPRMRLFDPLSNLYIDTSSVEELGQTILARLRALKKFTRQGSRSVGPAIAAPEGQEFRRYLEIVQSYGERFHELIHPADGVNRYLGNTSFRAAHMSADPKYENLIFISQRNIDKRNIDAAGFVAVTKDSFTQPRIEYFGTPKPSVDTPTQVQFFDKLPRVNYILHAHVYIEGAPFTREFIPCGSLEEVAEIMRLIGNDSSKTNFAINLLGHGSLIFAGDLDYLSQNGRYHARPRPESLTVDGKMRSEMRSVRETPLFHISQAPLTPKDVSLILTHTAGAYGDSPYDNKQAVRPAVEKLLRSGLFLPTNTFEYVFPGHPSYLEPDLERMVLRQDPHVSREEMYRIPNLDTRVFILTGGGFQQRYVRSSKHWQRGEDDCKYCAYYAYSNLLQVSAENQREPESPAEVHLAADALYSHEAELLGGGDGWWVESRPTLPEKLRQGFQLAFHPAIEAQPLTYRTVAIENGQMTALAQNHDQPRLINYLWASTDEMMFYFEKRINGDKPQKAIRSEVRKAAAVIKARRFQKIENFSVPTGVFLDADEFAEVSAARAKPQMSEMMALLSRHKHLDFYIQGNIDSIRDPRFHKLVEQFRSRIHFGAMESRASLQQKRILVKASFLESRDAAAETLLKLKQLKKDYGLTQDLTPLEYTRAGALKGFLDLAESLKAEEIRDLPAHYAVRTPSGYLRMAESYLASIWSDLQTNYVFQWSA